VWILESGGQNVSIKERLVEIVGPGHVVDQRQDLEAYSKDESPFAGVVPSFVVRPGNADQIRSLVRMANKEKIPMIPASSGIHFNGTTLPTQGGVILDLGRMDRIIEVDIRNRRAMIEPGVKWGQLQKHLKRMDMVAMNPLFPHPLQSVAASYLERHPLIIPKFEYAEPISTLEVVLPSGELLRTGSAASPGAPFDTVADMVCPYGPGLDFYRLFQGAQGTLGIITWMNLKIEYLSPLRKTYFLQSDNLPELLGCVQRVQRLMIGNECFILKRPDVAAIASGGNPDIMKEISGEIKTWMSVIQIAGARWRPEERIQYQEKAFDETCQEYGMTPMDYLSKSGVGTDIFEKHLQGPWTEGKPYWKYLEMGGCHDIAFHTTFERLPRLVGEAELILSNKGVEEKGHGLYIQPLENGRAYYCRFHLFYDPADKGQTEKVKTLDEILNRTLLLGGALFNTPYGAQVPLTYDHAAMYTETLKKVKDIFDPMKIMNPGRLCY